MLADHAHVRPLGIGILETVGEPVSHRIAEHQHVALRRALALLRRRRLGKILADYLFRRLLLEWREKIAAEPAAATAVSTAARRRRPLRSTEIIAEIEELRGGWCGDPDQ